MHLAKSNDANNAFGFNPNRMHKALLADSLAYLQFQEAIFNANNGKKTRRTCCRHGKIDAFDR